MALLDTQVGVLANQAMNYLVSGKSPHAARQRPSQHRALPDVFPVADGHLIIAVGNDGQYAQALRRARAGPALADDPRFATNARARRATATR